MSFWPDTCRDLLRPLKHACLLNPEVLPESTDPDYEFEYIDIGNVTLSEGIVSRQLMKFGNSPRRARKPVRPGDVIISTVRTYLKAVAPINENADNWVASTGFAVLRPSRHINARFLFRAVQSSPFIDEVVAASTGVSYPAITPSALGEIPVPVPDLDTQKAIADFLDRETARIDQLIEKKKRQVELLQEKLRAVISAEFDALSVRDVKVWRLRHLLIEPLKYGANESADGDAPDSIRFIRITDLTSDGELRDDTIKTLPAEKAHPYMLRDGDILLARSGATVGKSFIYRATFGPCCFAGYLIRARLRLSLISPEFFKRFTEANQYWDFISLSNIQATIQNVSAERYANLAVPLPSLEEQKIILESIVRVERPLRQAQQKVGASIERLREFRAALITAAVTGQIDVATWGKRGETDRRLDKIEQDMATPSGEQMEARA